MVARRFNSQHPGKIIRRSQRKQGVGRGPRATVVSGPPAASYPKYPPGFDRKPQGPLWACLVGYHRHTRWAGTAKPIWTELLGEGSSFQAHADQPRHPSPALSYWGSTLHGGWSGASPLPGCPGPGVGAHSPGLRPRSPRRLMEQPQVRGSGIRCPCSALSSAAAFLSML